MKYINHINLALAVAGVAVMLYALSQTFFSLPRQATLDLQELRVRGSREASQRRSTEATAIFRGATTTQVSSTTESVVSRPARQPVVTGVPRVDPARGVVGTSPRPGVQTPGTTESRPIRIGQRPEGIVPVPPGFPPEGAVPVDDDGFTPPPQRPRTGALTVPPPGVEAEKRDSGSDPSPPPVRSSMPARRPQ